MLGELDFEASGGRYGFDLGLSEEVTESLLTRYLQDHGGAVTRGTRLVGIRQGADHVVATLDHDGVPYEVEASWIVGCDGFHSTVRRLVGIDHIGADLEVPWAVFDATLEGWNDDGDICHPIFDVPPVILTPLPEGRWRIYLRPSSDHGDIVADAARTIRRYAPSAVFTEVENPNRFLCHSAGGGPIPLVSGVLGGGRGARVLAHGGARNEHRPPGRVQPGLETRPHLARCRGECPARQLRGRAAPRGATDRGVRATRSMTTRP